MANDQPDGAPLIVTLHGADKDCPRPHWHFSCSDAGELGIGRSPEMAIQIDEQTLSRRHATISRDADDWVFHNHGLNGSYCHGRRIEQPIVIEDGMVIRLSRDGPQLRFETGEKSQDDDQPKCSNTVTLLLAELAEGDDNAATQLWEQYFRRVAQLAKLRLSPSLRRVTDEEDVAASVFKSLFLGVSEGNFPELANRENLWRLLSVMTARKAADYAQHHGRAKRGGGRVRGESVFFGDEESSGIAEFVQIANTPDFQAQFAEEVENRLSGLENETLRRIAQLKLEGYTNDEIAEQLNCNARTVQRRLQEIRAAWSK